MRSLSDTFFRGKSSWLIPLTLLIISTILFEITPWDMDIQRHFYTPGEGWIIKFNRYRGLGLLYYQGTNILIGCVAAFNLFWLIRKYVKTKTIDWRPIYILLCIITIPVFIAIIKRCNNMPYPSKIVEFGGRMQRRDLITAFRNPPLPNGKRYRGWPAGHASGTFSLLGTAFIPEDRKRRWIGFSLATVWGFFVGICHCMDGNHFFSHNFVTYFIAWVLAALLYQYFTRSRA